MNLSKSAVTKVFLTKPIRVCLKTEFTEVYPVTSLILFNAAIALEILSFVIAECREEDILEEVVVEPPELVGLDPELRTIWVNTSLEIVVGSPFEINALNVSDPKPPSAPYLGKILAPYFLIKAFCKLVTSVPRLPFLSGNPLFDDPELELLEVVGAGKGKLLVVIASVKSLV